jgi:hypothetical protein
MEKASPSSGVHFVIRVVDDFMFVSTEKEAVSRFLSIAHSGLPSFGINVNKEKSRCSFDFQSETLSVPKVISKERNGDEYFSWCGLLFNTCTGAVRVDYGRFSTGRADDSFLMNQNGSEGLRLMSKMKGFLRPRSLPLLYDLRINTINDILVNYCQAVLLSAVKTHAYVSRLDGGHEKNPVYLLSVIDATLDYFYSTIRLRLKVSFEGSKRSDDEDSPLLLFSKNITSLTAKWLGLNIFASTWSKKTHSEHIIVAMLTNRYRSLNIRNEVSLQIIVNEAMEMLDSIYSYIG